MPATVSVVMATYNGARFVRQQLDSLAAQHHLPYELIVSDDGSADDTVDVVEEFRETAPFPVVLRRNRPRLGYGENFLSAAALATGEHIAFCDQDDVWCPTKLATAVDRLRHHRADLFVHTATVIDDAGRRTGRRFDQGIRRPAVVPPLHLGAWSVFYGCTMVFRRDLLDLVAAAQRGGHTFEYEGLLSHDLWVYFLATSLGTVVLDDTALIDYRQHQTNATPGLGTGFRSWLHLLGVPADPQLRRGAIAEHRAALMDALQTSTAAPDTRLAAERAARYWRRISAYERARVALYLGRHLPGRAADLLALARTGAYRPAPAGGLGPRLMLKDVLVGVLPLRQLRTAVTGSLAALKALVPRP